MIGLRLGILSLLASAVASAFVIFACGGAAFTTATGDGGGPSEDAGPPTRDAATPSFCATDGSAFDFCADFDEPLPGPWNSVAMPGAATVEENDAESTSPPNSLLASAPEVSVVGAGDAATHPNVYAIVTKSGLAKGGTHIQFDFRLDELSFPNGTDQTASVVALAYTQGTYAVYLAFRAVAEDMAPFDPWLVETITPALGATPIVPPPTSLHGLLAEVGVWTHVEIDFDIDDTTVLADGGFAVQGTITVSGQAPRIVTLHPPPSAATQARTLSVGVSSTAATGAAKLRFDNVTYSHTAP